MPERRQFGYHRVDLVYHQYDNDACDDDGPKCKMGGRCDRPKALLRWRGCKVLYGPRSWRKMVGCTLVERGTGLAETSRPVMADSDELLR